MSFSELHTSVSDGIFLPFCYSLPSALFLKYLSTPCLALPQWDRQRGIEGNVSILSALRGPAVAAEILHT